MVMKSTGNWYDILSEDGDMIQAMSISGAAITVLSIYFIAYSITVLASVKKNQIT